MGNIGRNVELEQFTQALYDARELAMSRMQAEAEELHAEGIVGVQLRQHSHTWGSHTTEFFAIGTAVRPLRDDHVIERPTMVLSLDSEPGPGADHPAEDGPAGPQQRSRWAYGMLTRACSWSAAGPRGSPPPCRHGNSAPRSLCLRQPRWAAPPSTAARRRCGRWRARPAWRATGRPGPPSA